jgi:hypothetical protein
VYFFVRSYRDKKVVGVFVRFRAPHQIKSLDMVGNMVKENGGKWFKNLEEISDFVNFNKI